MENNKATGLPGPQFLNLITLLSLKRGFIKHYETKLHNFRVKDNSELKYHKHEHFVSKPRLDRFLNACGNSKSKAQKLYIINLRVSQETYPLLNLFEIFLRNGINEKVSAYFTDTDWIVNQKSRVVSNPSLAPSRYQMQNSVQGKKYHNSEGGGSNLG